MPAPWEKSDFIALWRAVLPPSYTDAIETAADGQGMDVPSAQAAIFARFERAANLTQQSRFLRRHSNQTGPIASSGTAARGTIYVLRAPPFDADIELPAGTRFPAWQLGSYGERVELGMFLSVSSVTLGGTLDPIPVVVEAEFPGYSGNLEFGGQITEFGELGRATVRATVVAEVSTTKFVRTVQPSEEGRWDTFIYGHQSRYARVVQLTDSLVSTVRLFRVVSISYETSGAISVHVTPPMSTADAGKVVQVEIEEWADLGLSVIQPNPITGGAADVLTAFGNERNSGRAPGETDAQYADRLQSLADTISPAAVERAVEAICSPLGIAWCLKETGDPDTLLGFIWDVHPMDVGGLNAIDKLPSSALIGQGNVFTGPSTARRFFIVCLSRSGLGEFGLGYDVPTSSTLPFDVGAWDGFAVGFAQAAGRVRSAVNQIRAAGINFRVLADCC